MDLRVRCVAIYDNQIVLIHRVRADKSAEYYFFPGGGVDEGELPEHACIREMLEEVALTVKPVKLLGIQTHTDRNGEHCQMYYLVDVVGGVLGKGDGIEYTEDFITEHGTHDPVTLSYDEFAQADTLRPGRIREQLVPHLKNLKEMPFFIIDDRSL